MSDEYSVHSRFLTGKLDEAGYLDKMDYMRRQAAVEELDLARSQAKDPRERVEQKAAIIKP